MADWLEDWQEANSDRSNDPLLDALTVLTWD